MSEKFSRETIKPSQTKTLSNDGKYLNQILMSDIFRYKKSKPKQCLHSSTEDFWKEWINILAHVVNEYEIAHRTTIFFSLC